MSFEWQTEDDGWHDPAPAAPDPPPAGRSRWGRISLLAVAVLVLAAGGIFIYRQANNRVSEVEALLEEDVLTSHRLVRLAAAEADYEIFVQVLSGRDPEWVAAQRELINRGQLFDRRGLGMAHIQPTAEPVIEKLAFSPDLTTAFMQTNESYAIDVGNGLSETVVLSQTVIYRQGPESWLFSPPLEDTWGEWMTHEGRYLTLVFPESEAEVAGRLAFDLENKLAELCSRVPGIDCPADFHIRVRLSKEPESLLLSADIDTLSFLSTADEMQLPAPRLVGMPVDEEGYRALLRGYAYYVVGGAFTQIVGYECCDQGIFLQEVVNQVLADLALHPRPIYLAIYRDLLQAGVDIADPYISWDSSAGQPAADETRQAAVVIAFVRHISPETSLLQIARSMDQAFSYWDWLRQLTPTLTTDEAIHRAWLDFLVVRSAINTQKLPYPLPDQDVLALCGLSNRSITGELYRYQVEDGSWQADAADIAFTNLLPVPGSETVTMVYADNRVLTEPEIALYSWVENQPLARWQPAGDDNYLYLYSVPEASGQHVLVSLRSIGGGESGLYAFDMAACAAGTCSPQVFDGIPYFAPGGEHVLVMLPTSPNGLEPFIYLTGSDDQRRVDLGSGRDPFWLDSETFGWVRNGEDGVMEIATGSISGNDVESLITLPDLIDAIPPDELPPAPDGDEDDEDGLPGPQFTIDAVAANPARADQLFISLDADSYLPNYFLLLERSTGRVTWRFTAGGTSSASPVLGFSPDGTWLTVELFNQGANQGEVILHQIDSGERETFPLSDIPYGLSWTGDSRWLAKVDGDWLVLIAPGTGYQQVTIHDLPKCGPAGWISR